MNDINETRPLTRREASTYLFNEHGIRRAPSTLAKLAVIGGGPRFRVAGRAPLYSPAELDKWAESILSPTVGSTSELRQHRTEQASQ